MEDNRNERNELLKIPHSYQILSRIENKVSGQDVVLVAIRCKAYAPMEEELLELKTIRRGNKPQVRIPWPATVIDIILVFTQLYLTNT
jgi:hypothetical protein